MKVARMVHAQCQSCHWGWEGMENFSGSGRDALNSALERFHNERWPGSECPQPKIIIRMKALKKRQRLILIALRDLGGAATTRQIAEKTGLHANGVSQSLGMFSSDYISHQKYLGRGETKWWLAKGAFL